MAIINDRINCLFRNYTRLPSRRVNITINSAALISSQYEYLKQIHQRNKKFHTKLTSPNLNPLKDGILKNTKVRTSLL